MSADFLSYSAANKMPPKGPEVPKDWQPTVEMLGDSGKAVIPRSEALPDNAQKEAQLLQEAGFDPKQYMISGEIGYRKWMRYDQEWLHYYKFNITHLSESSAALREMTIADRMKIIRAPKKRIAPPVSSDDCFVMVASDWQIGKGEGDGTPGTMLRVSDGIDQSVRRAKELRRIGRKMSQGAFLGTGDLVEGTCGFYTNQPFLIDMNDREQSATVADLLTYGIEELSPLFDEFTLATSLDNHGQKRTSDGKLTTDLSDNKTAECYDVVKRAFDRDARYDNLKWVIPKDETSILIELGGVPIGLTHGDLFYGGGKLPQMKALEWWKGQDFGMQPLRGAQIMMSGHFHHYSCILHGQRTHFQMPANDPGSKWFQDSSGYDSPPGTFTVRIDSNLTYGWTDEMILVA